MVRPARLLMVLALASGVLARSPDAAFASFHEIKITEVHASGSGMPLVEAVELQMYAANQNFVANKVLKFYNASGTAVTDCTVPGNADNGATQDYILFATVDFTAAYGPSADFEMPSTGLIDGAGGAICWAGQDCVTWGSFGQIVADVDGNVVNPEGPIPDDESIDRITGGRSRTPTTTTTATPTFPRTAIRRRRTGPAGQTSPASRVSRNSRPRTSACRA